MARSTKFAILSAATLALTSVQAGAAIITQWNFNASNAQAQKTVTSNPTPTTGAGTASSLGMTNAYTYANGEGPGSVDGSNLTNVVSAAVPSFNENTYKIVGNSNKANSGAGKANGWNNAAPDYTQGVEFSASTVGYSGVNIAFDWYCTTQGVANMQVRYTLDGTTFTNLGSDYVATPNDFYGATAAGVPQPSISIDLSSIPGAANDPTFGIEMVSVRPVVGDADYFGTGPGVDGDYASAATTAAVPTDYNNNSGNWSFDNITIGGTAVPEPATLSVAGIAVAGLLARRRRVSR